MTNRKPSVGGFAVRCSNQWERRLKPLSAMKKR